MRPKLVAISVAIITLKTPKHEYLQIDFNFNFYR